MWMDSYTTSKNENINIIWKKKLKLMHFTQISYIYIYTMQNKFAQNSLV